MLSSAGAVSLPDETALSHWPMREATQIACQPVLVDLAIAVLHAELVIVELIVSELAAARLHTCRIPLGSRHQWDGLSVNLAHLGAVAGELIDRSRAMNWHDITR
jgi:hypothetical protein